ncbi:putative 3-hydroxydecanoyl-(acyl-carrier-protein) dehydratase [Desulfamplus magnetovallimortis]|uniref:Putative 3-hydroxydecanoyl-(Acyl-carrier-protein) dehydratase n=1 Tax=Desulfamplus magnetovallimortis TaxID=1246637 RepID=A0A1W1H9J7_9BACT|nr:SDR family NAD(P)-dependent oxidoreductase [Desulfamplus magnetovallimortis]SLM29157.1 putative 3-hydroxydecanoyl-(acyl-carrier-protein) dehydratase [Desulfamplus magnetovallimortis]
MRSADDKGAFFTTISFLGGTFGFGEESIVNPCHGALSALAKTAALEWKGVVCKSIDMPFSVKHAVADADIAVSLMRMPGEVEIGLIENICIFPELVTSHLPLSDHIESHTHFSQNSLTKKTTPGESESQKAANHEAPPAASSSLNHLSQYKNNHIPLSSEDVVVITGGAKGVTAQCAVEIAEAFSPVIILIGRSPLPAPEPEWMRNLNSEKEIKSAIIANLFIDSAMPSPMKLQEKFDSLVSAREIEKTLNKIKSAGSKVKYYSSDIRQPESVKKTFKAVREEFGNINMIIHGAGVLKDKLIIDKTEEQFKSVFETKVEGMKNLLQFTHNDPIKYVVFFSSVAARTGNRGQVDYAMANEILNKTAQFYSKNPIKNRKIKNDTDHNISQCRFISINWGPWEGGMVTAQLQKEFIQQGIELIPLKEGAKYLVDELKESAWNDVEIVTGGSLASHNPQLSSLEKSYYADNVEPKPVALFSREQILEFATGKPSKAFGELYREFDHDREIARLPGPPYFFMDRVIKTDAPQWEMKPGGWIECQFDIPADGWYFKAAASRYMPFSVLLEIALQPCGWLAAYAGSALKSKERLYFRNLGGTAEFIRPVHRKMGTLTMRSRMSSVSHAGGIIIQNFDMEVSNQESHIYKGTTNFGFFTQKSLSNQTGIRNSELHQATLQSISDKNKTLDVADLSYFAQKAGKRNSSNKNIILELTKNCPLTPDDANWQKKKNGMPSKALLMIDTIDKLLTNGGKFGKGFIQGTKNVNPEEWFFKAHFYQDPVCPGSLGVESFLQLMQFYALEKWAYNPEEYGIVMPHHTHQWIYRGQITPSCKTIKVVAHIKKREESKKKNEQWKYSIEADGLLYVDELCIYQMENFKLQIVPHDFIAG